MRAAGLPRAGRGVLRWVPADLEAQMTKPVLVGYDPRRIDHTPVAFGFRIAN